MRGGAVLGLAWVITAAVVSAESAAAAPVQVIPVGKAVITVDEGCLARVVSGKYKKAVPPGGRMVLPTGTYRIKVRPGVCRSSKKKIRVRKGKTVRAKVRMVEPTTVN